MRSALNQVLINIEYGQNGEQQTQDCDINIHGGVPHSSVYKGAQQGGRTIYLQMNMGHNGKNEDTAHSYRAVNIRYRANKNNKLARG